MLLISFQKFCHYHNLRYIHVQNQKIFIARHQYDNDIYNRRCQYRRLLCITHFGEFIQVQYFRSVDQFKRKFQKETVKKLSFCWELPVCHKPQLLHHIVAHYNLMAVCQPPCKLLCLYGWEENHRDKIAAKATSLLYCLCYLCFCGYASTGSLLFIIASTSPMV